MTRMKGFEIFFVSLCPSLCQLKGFAKPVALQSVLQFWVGTGLRRDPSCPKRLHLPFRRLWLASERDSSCVPAGLSRASQLLGPSACEWNFWSTFNALLKYGVTHVLHRVVFKQVCEEYVKYDCVLRALPGTVHEQRWRLPPRAYSPACRSFLASVSLWLLLFLFIFRIVLQLQHFPPPSSPCQPSHPPLAFL